MIEMLFHLCRLLLATSGMFPVDPLWTLAPNVAPSDPSVWQSTDTTGTRDARSGGLIVTDGAKTLVKCTMHRERIGRPTCVDVPDKCEVTQ